MKVFYSWQSDSPAGTNRYFIRDALNQAIQALNSEMELTASDRGDPQVSLDHDTQGILGSPPVAQAIFDKISETDVFVADVTLVAVGHETSKKHINSNVAIELGYAYGKINYEPIVKVMNTAHGEPNELPFDLSERRFPISYSLNEDASSSEKQDALNALATTLKNVLKLYLDRSQQTSRFAHFEEARPTYMRGAYWARGEPLLTRIRNWDRSDYYANAESVFYFRCIPLSELPTLSSRAAFDATAELCPLSMTNGCSRERNTWGAISFEAESEEKEVLSGCQVLRNREIWSFDSYLATRLAGEIEDRDRLRIIPTGALLRDYPRGINSARACTQRLEYGDRYTVEFGLSGALGAHMVLDRGFVSDRYPGPIHENDVFIRREVETDTSTSEIYNSLIEKLFDEAGAVAPRDALMPDD